MRRLIVFAKTPRLHEVKTRLVPPLTPEQALLLHTAFVEDQAAFAGSLGRVPENRIEGELCVDLPPAGPGPPSWARGLPVSLQGAGDLGTRMARAFERAFSAGATAVAILGSDAPALPDERVREVFDHLAAGRATVVVVPAEDGGYVMIGSTRPAVPLFAGVPWGGPSVLEATRRLAAEAGIAYLETPAAYDVDRPEDLPRLRADLERDPDRAPTTLAALRRLYSRFPPVL